MRVLHIPDWRESNPYQRLLAGALEPLGVESRFARGERWLPLAREVARHAPDVVHLHAVEAFLLDPRYLGALARGTRLLAEAAALRFAGVPIVYTMHNLLSHQRHHPRLERWVNRAFLKRCGGVILHGASGVPMVRESLGEAVARRCRVIPHGSFLEPYQPVPGRGDARKRLGLPPAPRVLLILGQLLSYKMVVETIEIVRDLPDEGFLLVVAGACREEGLRDRVEGAAAEDPRIRLDLDFVPEDLVATYFGAADVVLIPYRHIFTSGSLVLCMSLGRPALISDTGLVRDYVDEEGAFLFEAGDREALRRAIQRVLRADAGELERMGEANLRAARALVWNDAAVATLEVYREALGHRPSGA